MESRISMEQKPDGKRSMGSEALTVLLSVGLGCGIGWILWITTSSNVLAIVMAGATSSLANNFLRNVIK